MDIESKHILRKLFVDFIIILCVGLPILFFYIWGVPYKRGFFCDDESLKHPYHDSTVTNVMLYFVGLAFPVALMIFIEIFECRGKSRSSRRSLLGRQLPEWLWRSYCSIGAFAFGVACSQLTTDIAKYSIGRLRPHFFDVCKPLVDCSDPANLNRYIEDFTCQGTNKRLIKEMRLSFPSGHSSFSAYTMLYCVMFLQARMKRRGAYLLRSFLQFLLLTLFWYTALSRISDYKHHWSDVLAGSLLGITIAIITARYVSNLFASTKSSMNSLPRENYNNDNEYEVTVRPQNGVTGNTLSA